MHKYRVIGTSIRHNSHVYKDGTSIELTAEQAERLEEHLDKDEYPAAVGAAKTQTPQTEPSAAAMEQTEADSTPAAKTASSRKGNMK